MNKQLLQALKEKNLLSEDILLNEANTDNMFELIGKDTDFESPQTIASIKDIASQYGITFSPKIEYGKLPAALIEKLPFDYLKKHGIAPFKLENKKISIALQSPTQRDKIDHLRIILGDFVIETHLTFPENINYVINEIFQQKDFIAFEIKNNEPKREQDFAAYQVEKTQITELADNIIAEAVRINATDIHLHPEVEEFKLLYRINGILHCLKILPKNIYTELISRLKIMASLDITKKNTPQDGSFSFEFSPKKMVDVRISFIPTTNAERVVLRILNHDKIFRPLETLGMNEDEKNIIIKNIKHSGGMILVNGPTGSGKTTTLYASLDIINNGKKNIITIEDPVEYNLTGIGQMQVSSQLTFSSALRSVLRQDPDVVMIGEIRDEETAQIAIRSALTGHLVLSTLHTNNSIQAVVRLVETGIEPYLIASAVTLSVSQRLIRILCDKCKKPATSNLEIIKEHNHIFDENDTVFEANGCDHCFNTGYTGREAIYEMLEITPEIKRMINNQCEEIDIYTHLKKTKTFIPLGDNALIKVKSGKTSLDEYLRILN